MYENAVVTISQLRVVHVGSPALDVTVTDA